MDEIHILQLGREDWSKKYKLPESVRLDYVENITKSNKKVYDLVFLDRTPTEEEIETLFYIAKVYTLFLTERVEVHGQMTRLYKCKKAQHLAERDIQRFLLEETRFYYSTSYGEKFELKNLTIAQGFSGSVKWNGNYNLSLEGRFGEDFCQVAFWRNNIPLFRGQVIDLWLEYYKDPEVSISLVVTMFPDGSISDISKQWEFGEEELAHVVQIENGQMGGFIFVSLYARGSGKLQIVALHDRYSRGRHGYFLPGGERHVTSDREEMFCYFHPGDLKPPLNVFFSGYKTRQGFEGYHMMSRMESPFLLIAESRLEGGCFYMGNKEYEQMYINIIKKYMSELNFTSDQVILAGISMGTYGALYYGCDIKPHAMILGKPLASIGNVGLNEKRLRPGGFPTSLDILRYLSGDTTVDSVKALNKRFWNKFDAADWGKSKFIVSYMLEDDYDTDAYDTLISHLWSSGVQVYGKGIQGRHNDDTPAIVNWFSSQFEKILREDFSRRVEK